MRPEFSFSYRLGNSGWSTATVLDGEHSIELTASYLSDALGDLTRAVIALLRGAEQATLTWDEEPGVTEWRFDRQDSEVEVCITLFDDQNSYGRFSARSKEPTFQTRCRLRRLAGEVLDELWHIQQTVGVDGYKERWKMHDFPSDEYKQLQDLLRQHTKELRDHRGADPQR